MKLTKEYWEKRYLYKTTGWDLGAISPPLKSFVDTLEKKDIKILIPGAGNSYEAEYLFLNEFQEIYVLDFAATPLNNLKKRMPSFPDEHLIQEDFFQHKGSYDLILEQTFFCALPVEKRPRYAQKLHELLNPGGTVAGVFFNIEFPNEGPPFGGNKTEYEEIFSKFFDIKILEPCTNSIPPRMGTELFFIFKKN